MQSANSSDYYSGRAQHAQGCAQAAASDDIKAIHLELAEQYARLAAQASPGNRSRSPLASR
jgi:hypothetical protein